MALFLSLKSNESFKTNVCFANEKLAPLMSGPIRAPLLDRCQAQKVAVSPLDKRLANEKTVSRPGCPSACFWRLETTISIYLMGKIVCLNDFTMVSQ
jgi:hypothetical protein